MVLNRKKAIIISVAALVLIAAIVLAAIFIPRVSGSEDVLGGAGGTVLSNADAVKRLNLKTEILQGDTSVVNMKINSREGFFVVDGAPTFNWNMNSSLRGEKQIAYAVGVASTMAKAQSGDFDVWYSGIFAGSTMNLIYGTPEGVNATTPTELKAQTVYYYAIQLYNKDGYMVPQSEVKNFEMGLQGDFGTDNKWIEASMPENPIDGTDLTIASSLFRKQFTLSQSAENIASARLYATAAGNHIMYLNGSRAGNDYMAPGKSLMTDLVYYQTYDVADKLISGENTIAAEVGHGWYNAGPVRTEYGTNTGLKAKLVVTYKDGTQQVINTDSSWVGTKEGHTTSNKYYSGQDVDGRRRIEGWNENNSVSGKWTAVTTTDEFVTSKKLTISSNFKAEIMDPVTVVEIFNPISVEKAGNKYIYKLPQNIAGTLRVTASAPRGTKITIDYSEHSSGSTNAYLDHNGVDSYIFAGSGAETVEFDLAYHGFQYIVIEGLSGEIPFGNIEALVLSSLSDSMCSFETSNSEMNKFVTNTMWTLRNNFVSTITDCPTREKNTWTGDAQIISAASTYYFNTYNIYDNFQILSRASQYSTGAMGDILPADYVNVNERSGNGSNQAWSDSIVIIPWNMYVAYDNKNTLIENYDAMKRYVDYVISDKTYNTTDSSAENYYIRKGSAYGDWLSYYTKTNKNGAKTGYYIKDEVQGQKWVETHYDDIATAYAAYISKIVSQSAAKLGKAEDAAYYADISEKYAAAWRANWLKEDGITPKSNSQTSYALGLELALYEESNRAAAAKQLAELVKKEDYKFTSGFVGVNWILSALHNNGQEATAFKLFFSDQERSLLYALRNGATTITEHIEQETGNHYVFGAASRWILGSVLGIGESDTDNTGYRRFILAPTYSTETGVTYAKGVYRSAAGEIVSDWKLSDDGKTFTYKCKIPANSTAVISLPITAQSNTITEGGIDAKTAEGLEFIEIKEGRAYFNAVSGEYNFIVNY